MGKVEKEKGILKLYVKGEHSTPYGLDINTGVLIGLKGMPIKTTPPYLVDFIFNNSDQNSVLTIIRYLRVNGYLKNVATGLKKERTLMLISAADKLDSIGYQLDREELRQDWRLDFLLNIDTWLKDFVKERKNNPNIGAFEFYSQTLQDKWLKEKNLQASKNISRQALGDLYIQLVERKNFILCEQNLSRTMYYLERGLLGLYNDGMFNALDKIENYFEYCQDLEIEPEKGDFLRAYNTARKNYLRKKTYLDNKAFRENQLAHETALSFDYGDYAVVIPVTNDELYKEGKNNHNCVGGYGNYILSGHLNVVFIRHKNNPEVSLITCEINVGQSHHRTGEISQYLGKYNRHVKDTALLEFKKKYQEHLFKNWEV